MTLIAVDIGRSALSLQRLSLALLLLVCLPGLVLTACEKNLRWDDDPPFSLQAADGTLVGIAVEINRAALGRLGCQARLRKLPWARMAPISGLCSAMACPRSLCGFSAVGQC